jgi:hypothetical protein
VLCIERSVFQQIMVSTGIRKMENQVCLFLCLCISLYWNQEDGEPWSISFSICLSLSTSIRKVENQVFFLCLSISPYTGIRKMENQVFFLCLSISPYTGIRKMENQVLPLSVYLSLYWNQEDGEPWSISFSIRLPADHGFYWHQEDGEPGLSLSWSFLP